MHSVLDNGRFNIKNFKTDKKAAFNKIFIENIRNKNIRI